jgi:Kef-type K+ transport system membrane component KefB
MEHATIEAAVLVGALLFLSKVGEEIAERLRLPGFLGSVVMGLVVSNAVLGVVTPEKLAPALLLFNLGINFTLFLAGVEELSNPSFLKPRRRELLVAAFIISSVSLVSMLFLVHVVAVELTAAFGLGVVLAIISAGPLMKILMARGSLGEREYAALKVGLLVEIAGLILFNTVMQGVSLLNFVETTVFVLLVYMFGRHYLDEVLLFIERHMAVKEAPFAIVVSIVIMAGYIAEMIGFNAAVTALLLGVFLSEYMELRPLYLERIRAFTYGFLEPLFFIGIGVYAAKPTPETIIYALLLLAVSAPPKIAASTKLGFKGRESFVLLAKGGVDAALLLALLEADMIDYPLYTAALLSILGSTILSSLAFRVQERRPDILRTRLADLELDMDIVHIDEPAEYAARIVATKGAAVVVDEKMRPVGYVVAEDFVDVDPHMLARIPVRYYLREPVPIVSSNTTLVELLSDITLLHEPIIAVVNERGEIVGTLTTRKLLSILMKQKH